jgi:hypothetical protein
MGSRKYEKATQNPTPLPSRGDAGANGGFWKKNSLAIPGRPNPSKVSASFQDFEQSVSDVWDIHEDEEGAQAAGQPAVAAASVRSAATSSGPFAPGSSAGGAVDRVTSASDLAATFGARRPSELSSQLDHMVIRYYTILYRPHLLNILKKKVFKVVHSIAKNFLSNQNANKFIQET